MTDRERHVLERAVHAIAEQAAAVRKLVDDALAATLVESDPLVVHAKELRLELLKTKAAVERELEGFSLICSSCGRNVHWVSGLAATPGHWAHAEPAPHGDPVL